eukprot:2836400-Prymnesium_polylepis.1
MQLKHLSRERAARPGLSRQQPHSDQRPAPGVRWQVARTGHVTFRARALRVFYPSSAPLMRADPAGTMSPGCC